MPMLSMFAGVKSRTRTARRTFAPSSEQFEDRVVLSVVPVGVPTLQVEHGQNMACETFTNTGTQPVKVSIAAYAIQDIGQGTAQNPWVPEIFRSQVYTASNTITLAPGQTKDVCVALPCGIGAFQIDAFEGDKVIKNFNGFPDYNGYNIAFNFLFDVTCPDTTKGNEGLGNGIDPPPPGHAGDTVQNDDPPSTPGSPNKGWNKP